MNISLKFKDVIPNLNNCGFLFGAGTSKEAGFPLTLDLTIKVLKSLKTPALAKLKKLIENEGLVFNQLEGKPDIETISDIIFKNNPQQQDSELNTLQSSIKENTIKTIKSVKTPKLDFHIKFLRTMKQLVGNHHTPVFIFTPNYDLLFERAAMEAKIQIVNGFCGINFRYFDINTLDFVFGTPSFSNGRKIFSPFQESFIKLIKLHGSISWCKTGNSVYEYGEVNSISPLDTSIILPRKQKIAETLDHPYDNLFTYSSRVIGSSQCKYLLSCGYSFGDNHINDRILFPKLKEGKISLFAFFKEEPQNISQLKQLPGFNYISENHSFINGQDKDESSDLWKFSRLVELMG